MFDQGIGDTAAQIQAVRSVIDDPVTADDQAIDGPIEPHTDFVMLDPQILNDRAATNASSDPSELSFVHALRDFPDDCEVSQHHRARTLWRPAAIKTYTVPS